MQHAELLTGANQYFCSICNAKADAIRQLRLKSLPPYLCLSLQRFVFDMKVSIHAVIIQALLRSMHKNSVSVLKDASHGQRSCSRLHLFSLENARWDKTRWRN